MWPIATDGVARLVGLFVCLCVSDGTFVSPGKTPEPIVMRFGG